jgi:hypothetical protein
MKASYLVDTDWVIDHFNRIQKITQKLEELGLVAQDTPGETDKNRCQSGETFKICDISDGRGDGIKIIIP